MKFQLQARRNEKRSAGVGGGVGWWWKRGLPIKKYCRPPWLTDEENFSFKSSKTARKTKYL